MDVAVQKESRDLVAIKVLTPAVVFGPGGVDDILGKIEREVRSVATDISTADGRASIASLAYKVARSKTALDEMGKELVADLKAKTGAVDAERRRIRDRLDALKEDVRKPLTEWENADKQRVDAHEQTIAAIAGTVDFGFNEPSLDEINRRLEFVENEYARDWEEFKKRAADARETTVGTLQKLREQTVKRAAERAELERLQREAAERAQQERDAKIAADAAEKAKQEAEAKAKREAEEAAAKANAERARVEQEKAEAVARAEKSEADRIAAAQKADGERLEALAKAERDKAAAIEAERARVAAEQAKAAAEQAARDADKKHRGKINGEVRDAIVELGVTAEHAVAVVTAIAKGAIPHVKISY